MYLYPYSQLYNLNLAWLLEKVKEVAEKVDGVILDATGIVDMGKTEIAQATQDAIAEINGLISGLPDTVKAETIAYLQENLPGLVTQATYNAQTETISLYPVDGAQQEEFTGVVRHFTLGSGNIDVPGSQVLWETEYHRVYVSDLTGSDENDGLSTEKPFKTLERAMQEYNRGFMDIRIYFLSPGNYTWSITSLNAVALHMVPQSAGVSISMDVPTQYPAFYNSHINIGSDDQRMTFTVNSNTTWYFEGGTTTLRNLDIYSNNRMSFIGIAYGWVTNCSLHNVPITTYGGSLRFSACVFDMQGVNDYAMNIAWGTVAVFETSCTVTSASEESSGFVLLNGATLISKVGLTGYETAKFARSLNCTNGFILMTDARIAQWGAAGGGVESYQNTFVNGVMKDG